MRRPTSGWDWFVLGTFIALTLALMFGGYVFGQPGDPRPSSQTIPIMGIDTSGRFVLVGDITNHALRVNVVAGGGAGGTSSNFGAAFPGSGTAAGFTDPAGLMAGASVTSNNALLVESLIPTTTNVAVRPGDAVNNAIRVNVVAGSGGGPSGTIGAAYPTTVAPAGARDASGFTASLTVTNAGRLNVTCDNCGGGSTFAAAFPSTGSAAGFKDGAGFLASATVDNAGFLLVTASRGNGNATPWNMNTAQWLGSTAPTVGQKTMANSVPVVIASDQSAVAVSGTVSATQGTSPWVVSGTVTATGTVTAHQGDTWSVNQAGAWTVTATGTVTAHQGDTWTVVLGSGSNTIGSLTANQSINLAQVGGTTTVNGGTAGLLGIGGPTATGSQASANPLRMGAVARPTNKPTVTDGNMTDLIVTDSGDLYVRTDTSAATGTIAPARVQMIGGTGQSANPSRIIACDNFATVTIAAAGTTQIIAGSAGQRVYICSINLVVSSATAINMIEGTGATCSGNVQGMFGGTTAGSGWNLATNGGLTQGTGVGMIGKTGQTGQNVCLQHSTAATVAGGITWTKF